MTAVAFEEAPAVLPAIKAAPARAAGPRSTARRPLPQAGRSGRSSGGRRPAAAGRGPGGRGYAPRHQAWAPPEPQAPAGRGFTSRDVTRHLPTDKAGRSNYQGIILAEFAAAVLLTALTPFATKKNPSGLSPYAGKDVLQLAALTLLYFLLALVSATGNEAARWAAWLGGLVLLTVGLAGAANLAQVIDLTGIGSSKAQAKSDQQAGSGNA